VLDPRKALDSKRLPVTGNRRLVFTQKTHTSTHSFDFTLFLFTRHTFLRLYFVFVYTTYIPFCEPIYVIQLRRIFFFDSTNPLNYGRLHEQEEACAYFDARQLGKVV